MRAARGFTLIELLVVVAIIALLIAILIPSLGAAKRKANTAKCLANTRSMGSAVQVYVADWQKMLPFTGNPSDSWTQVLGRQGTSNTSGGGYGVVAKLRICPEAALPATTNVATVPWYGTAHFAWGNSAETGPDPVTMQPLTASYGLNGYLYKANPPAAIATITGDPAKSYSVPVGRSETEIPVFVDCVWRHVLPKPTDRPGADLENPGPDDVVNQPISKIMINRHDKAVNVSFLDGHASTTALRDLYTIKWSIDWVQPTTIPPIPAH